MSVMKAMNKSQLRAALTVANEQSEDRHKLLVGHRELLTRSLLIMKAASQDMTKIQGEKELPHSVNMALQLIMNSFAGVVLMAESRYPGVSATPQHPAPAPAEPAASAATPGGGKS